MKKIYYFLAILSIISFSSCENAEDLIGSCSLKINSKDYNFVTATFVKTNDVNIITSGDLENIIAIKFSGNSSGNYKLGSGTNLTNAIANISDLSYDNNILLFYPIGNETEAFVSLYGTIHITEYNNDKIIGNFSGKGIKKSTLEELLAGDISNLLQNVTSELKDFSGNLTAIKFSAKK